MAQSQRGFATDMLWEVIGPALFAGLAVILFNVPLTYFNTMLMGKASNRLMVRNLDWN